jgi:hypothetical protein
VTATGRSDLRPRLDPTHLAVARFAADWQPPSPVDGFFALVRDEDETTLVCPEHVLDDPAMSPALRDVERGWRRITFPGPLPWELVGFLADVAGRLAAAQIPFTSMSGFTTDHVLVRAAQADLAVAVLSGGLAPAQQPGTNP